MKTLTDGMELSVRVLFCYGHSVITYLLMNI